MKEWNVVDVLRHSRHDWLNKLQLIKANIDLNRIDRVKDIIEEIVMETQNEAKLTNLQLDKLAGFLMTYNWECHNFSLEFEVLGNTVNLSSYDDEMVTWCDTFFTLLNESVLNAGENHLSLSIHTEDSDVRFFFDFSGTITDSQRLHDWLQSQVSNNIPVSSEFSVSEKELSFELLIQSEK
ncbi:sporulation initiation phosphotransferase B [Bacillus suaedaesalsae]|uniref:Sporulation initiation phosphotransferase B n=1 Tax=Bacillus suaedaesalsae TaxID=2810349 RepID=A0ABS2DPS2_9BACI|nr:sporulation initiation phosphotransferase B [Bacillus suaedaesalsae]MBM6619736.1 sporulation initiation phosphotransferase B [Bacillus suaedaesalsae]